MRWAGSRHLLHDLRFFTIRKKISRKIPKFMAGPTCTGTRPGRRRDTRHRWYPWRNEYAYGSGSVQLRTAALSVRERLFLPV